MDAEVVKHLQLHTHTSLCCTCAGRRARVLRRGNLLVRYTSILRRLTCRQVHLSRLAQEPWACGCLFYIEWCEVFLGNKAAARGRLHETTHTPVCVCVSLSPFFLCFSHRLLTRRTPPITCFSGPWRPPLGQCVWGWGCCLRSLLDSWAGWRFTQAAQLLSVYFFLNSHSFSTSVKVQAVVEGGGVPACSVIKIGLVSHMFSAFPSLSIILWVDWTSEICVNPRIFYTWVTLKFPTVWAARMTSDLSFCQQTANLILCMFWLLEAEALNSPSVAHSPAAGCYCSASTPPSWMDFHARSPRSAGLCENIRTLCCFM